MHITPLQLQGLMIAPCESTPVAPLARPLPPAFGLTCLLALSMHSLMGAERTLALSSERQQQLTQGGSVAPYTILDIAGDVVVKER